MERKRRKKEERNQKRKKKKHRKRAGKVRMKAKGSKEKKLNNRKKSRNEYFIKHFTLSKVEVPLAHMGLQRVRAIVRGAFEERI